MTSLTKFYHMLQIILQMRSCDQSFVTLAFLWEKLSWPQFYKDLTRKKAFFEGWSWFKFNNLGLALDMALKFYTSVQKGLQLRVRKICGLISTFVEVIGEKLLGGPFCPLPPTPILNKVKGNVDILLISETKLNNSFCIGLILIEGFSTPCKREWDKTFYFMLDKTYHPN